MKHQPPPEIEIEKGVPIPTIRIKWPQFFAPLQDGDSFVVDNCDQRDRILSQAKRYGVLVTSRKLNGEGYRIWKLPKLVEPKVMKAA